ncbi:MAG: hypothetical protein ACK5MD_08240 [Flavobacteriales bacterium]
MNKEKKIHPFLSIFGVLLLWMQILMISFHQMEHQHDDTPPTQECHLCFIYSQNHFIENNPISVVKTVETVIFHEKIVFIHTNLYDLIPEEILFLRGPPVYFT